MDVEDAFIIRKHNLSNGETYELTDASLAMYSHKNVFTSQEIQQYLELAKTILEERDCLFDEPFN